jgi:penicillin G amidase
MPSDSGPGNRMGLALRDLVASRPVRAVRALVRRAIDARASSTKRVETPVERVRGLDGSITIARDRYGIPGVFANNPTDLAFGMGWSCAEDRLFQIELMRRAFRGELAATFGDRPVDERTTTKLMAGRTFVDLDAFTRAIDFRKAAEASYAIASAEARMWLDSYAAGINAYLASGRRSLEMLLLDIEPTPWTAADAIVIGKGIAFQLSFNYRFALARALCEQSVDTARLSALLPVVATTELLRTVVGTDGLHLGSNCFAVSSKRSADGRAMLASDPHMPLSAPAIFWEVRLRGGGIDARGAGIPGFPALPIGQNAHAVWGCTAGWGDDTQLYRETEIARTRRETIAIKGGSERTIEIGETPRGPIVSHVIGHELETAISLRWTGRDATLDTDAALGLLRGRTVEELRAAARHHGGPTLNFVFADRDGHVGFQYAGRVPRRSGNGTVSGIDIADADDPRAEWRGMIPAEELPFELDPPSGVIVSSNTRPESKHFLGALFEPPFRRTRIKSLLAAHEKLSAADLRAIQRDVRSAWATLARDALLAGLDDDELALPPRRGRALVREMRAWDGEAREQSVGAAATYMFLEAALRHIFLDDLGELAFERYFEIMNAPSLPLLAVLAQDHGWLEGRDRATLVRDAAAMAEGRLRRLLGDDPAQWRWGSLHTITFRHAFHDVPGLRAVSSPGPYPARGDGTTVCMGEYDLRGGNFAVRTAPAFRMIAFAGAPHDGRAVLPPGNSGDPTSRHYRDQTALYLAGELREMAWDEDEFVGRRERLTP